MHISKAFSSIIRLLSRSAFYAFCGLGALWCLYEGDVFATEAKKRPAAQSPSPLLQTVDSHTLTQRGAGYRINISYPKLDNPVADAELAIWAREQAVAFTDSVRMLPTPPPMPYELFITYEKLQASPRVTSVVFVISTFMGGAHPEPGLATFVYDKRNGRRLSYSDLFLDQEEIALTFSSLCRKSLIKQLGNRAVADMLDAGTAPVMANFDLFAMVKNGVRIYFPPYQVAPYVEGRLEVTIPLHELTRFKPHMDFWDTP